jgi:orotidine-5'-phosphate decarboxylase
MLAGYATLSHRMIWMPHALPSLKPHALDRLIVALDVPNLTAARELAGKLQGVCRWVKVGLELYVAAGNPVVEELASQGYSVFLDLKFHDIPNTVAGAVRSAATVGASMLTVHAAGGPAMLQAAAEAAASSTNSPRLLAVTVLTSMDGSQLASVGIEQSPAEQVLRLARMAQTSDVPGLVSSAEEVRMLRQELGGELYLVTPGIRPAGGEAKPRGHASRGDSGWGQCPGCRPADYPRGRSRARGAGNSRRDSRGNPSVLIAGPDCRRILPAAPNIF